ncbi:MAG: hypothetical protein WEB37_06210 [Bacteroidota bacterium]
MKHQGFRQAVAWLLVTVHVVMIYGCSVTNRITLPGNEIPAGSNFKIATVILKGGETIKFDVNGGRYVERTSDGKSYRVIVGMTDGKNIEIDPEKVFEVRFEQEESSGGGSFIAGFLIGMPVGAGVFYLILVAAFSGH